jgi:uncharacterized membrane-anchored protein YhcB (DUF1043 family)
MIPRVAQKGYGFAGAGLYYLSDKRPDAEDQRDRPAPDAYMLSPKRGELGERVGFTETRNLPTRDPHKALRCMQWLAAHATDLRLAAAAAAARAAGMSFQDYIRTHNPMRGQKGKKPVYTLSIAWHPTKNTAPTRPEMIAAGDEVLKRLGVADRQCLMVSHTDRPHPHLHLIVNRVSPLNGKYAALGNDYLTLSAWALDYERRTGHILCVERMLNWERRRGHRDAKAEARKTDPNAKGRYVRGKDTPRPDHEWWRKVQHLPDADIRAARAKKQATELKSFETRMAKGLVRLEARIARTQAVEHATLSAELTARKAAHEAAARRQGGSLKARMKRLAELVSVHRFRSARRIKALTRDIAALERSMADRRSGLRAEYAAAWTSLERRHLAERQRDEMRITARGGKERGDAAIARARKVFNARGRADTARLFANRPSPRALILAWRKAARTRYGERLQGRTALARALSELTGRPHDAAQLRRESIVSPDSKASGIASPLPGEAPADRAPAETRDAVHQAKTTARDKSASGRSDREAAIAAEMERVKERGDERVRRKRQRPRGGGRVRRLE